MSRRHLLTPSGKADLMGEFPSRDSLTILASFCAIPFLDRLRESESQFMISRTWCISNMYSYSSPVCLQGDPYGFEKACVIGYLRAAGW